MNCKIEQGKGGRWRWYAYDDDERLAASGPVQGYATREHAAKALGRFLAPRRTIWLLASITAAALAWSGYVTLFW